MGRGDVVGVVLVVALCVAGLIGLAVRLEPMNHRCPGGGVPSEVGRVADDLGAAAARLPGVVAAMADYSPGDCDRLRVALTVDANADPDQVAAAVAFVAAGLGAPELRVVSDVRASVEDDGPEHSPAGGRPSLSLFDGSRATHAVAAVARAWAQLKGRYRSTEVEVGHYYDSVRVQLPRRADSAAIREAFEVLRSLGLAESTSGNLTFWNVGVAGPGPIVTEPDIHYQVRGDLSSPTVLASMEAVAGWSAALGSEIAVVTKAVWSEVREGDEPPGLTVRATVDVDAVGRTVDEVADDLAARLAGAAASYHVKIAASTDPPRSADRVSG